MSAVVHGFPKKVWQVWTFVLSDVLDVTALEVPPGVQKQVVYVSDGDGHAISLTTDRAIRQPSQVHQTNILQEEGGFLFLPRGGAMLPDLQQALLA